MFDSLFNYVIFLIPLAIFIGRAVVQARARAQKKQEAPPPVFAEIKELDIPHWERAAALEDKARKAPASKAKKQKAPPRLLQEHLKPGGLAAAIESKSPPVLKAGGPVGPAGPKEKTAAEKPAATARPGLSYLSHLTPMQQAVLMAEVLGPPKSLR